MTTATLEAAVLAPMHPALRWAPPDEAVQHRRTLDGNTVCGLSGPLVPAEPTHARCARGCFPDEGV